jgi:Flp pilus assembly protein CpaB
MEATTTPNKIGGRSLKDMMSTRGGATAAAAVAAILAGILLFAFVQQYRKSQNASTASTPVFVATSLIPQGSSADVIASEQLLQRTAVRGSQVQSGAIADPSVLHGQVAVRNIYPGQQITASDFTSSSTVASQLTAADRAVSVPVDAAHGLVGYVHTGDHVDALASFSLGAGKGTVTRLAQDVLVLSAPSGNGALGGTNNSDILLRVSDKDAAAFAYAADNGKVWILLRPPLGATQSTASASAQPTSPVTATAEGGH